MIRFFAAHPTAGNLLMLLILAAGIVALPTLRRETFPDFQDKEVQIRVPYPGATPEEVEEAICTRIEDALDDVDFVEEIRSEARESVGTVTVRMAAGADFVSFLGDVKTEVDGIDDFPEEAEEPVVSRTGLRDAVVSIAILGPEEPTDLKAWCEGIRDRLRELPEVSQVSLEGFGEHRIRIQAETRVLQQFGLGVRDLAAVVTRQSVDLPAGTVETRDREVLVRFREERRRPDEFRDLVVVSGPGGGEIRLGDVAEVSELFDPAEEKILFNGRRAGLLRITKTKSEDTLRIRDAVGAFVDRERVATPAGVEFHFTEDVSSIVRDRLRMLTRNGLQGLLLVFLVMWLFFSLRFSFWVALGVPVSFLGTFFVMEAMGHSINMITMVALLLGLGLLMDDAIVLSENISTHLRRGKKPLRATVDGVAEVRGGVISSFLTTVCVLGPLAFITGHIGEVIKFIPMVLVMVLAVSLVEAFLILPGHLAHSVPEGGEPPPGRIRRRVEAVIDGARERVLGPVVDAAVRWRWASLGLTLAVLLASVGMLAGGRLKVQVFPDIDGDIVLARVLLPQGTPLRRTEEVVERITTALAEVDAELTPLQPRGARLVRSVMVRFNRNADARESGAHLATVSADLLPAEERSGRVDDILNLWREKVGGVPDVLTLKFGEPAVGPAGRPIDVRLRGDDLEELQAASYRTREWLGGFRGVHDLGDDLRPGKPEVAVGLLPGALDLGLDAGNLSSQIRSAVHGITAAEFQAGPEEFEVDVRLRGVDRDTLGDLEGLRVTLPDGRQVPLEAVASLEPGRGYARIARVDGKRTVSVQGDLDPRSANTVELMDLLRAELLPELAAAHPGVTVDLEGEIQEGETTRNSMLRGLSLGVLGIFVLLSFQFRSYAEPVAVMAAIPLTLVGVVWGHLLLGHPLTMPSIMGLLSLAGIVVNDSILLILFARARRTAGTEAVEASRLASRDRFRAVVLTSVTTIAGMTPLLAERSLQAQVLVPLAISIVFGLLASTVLVLVVIPCFYAALADAGLLAPAGSGEHLAE